MLFTFFVIPNLQFVTEGYTLLFAMEMLDLPTLDTVPTMTSAEAEEALNYVSTCIVDTVWNDVIVHLPSSDLNEKDTYEYCICKEGG